MIKLTKLNDRKQQANVYVQNEDEENRNKYYHRSQENADTLIEKYGILAGICRKRIESKKKVYLQAM